MRSQLNSKWIESEIFSQINCFIWFIDLVREKLYGTVIEQFILGITRYSEYHVIPKINCSIRNLYQGFRKSRVILLLTNIVDSPDVGQFPWWQSSFHSVQRDERIFSISLFFFHPLSLSVFLFPSLSLPLSLSISLVISIFSSLYFSHSPLSMDQIKIPISLFLYLFLSLSLCLSLCLSLSLSIDANVPKGSTWKCFT